MAPPSQEELAAIEDERVGWARLLGASIEEDRDLGGLLVTNPAPGSSFNYLAAVRWSADKFDAQLWIEVRHDRRVAREHHSIAEHGYPAGSPQPLRSVDRGRQSVAHDHGWPDAALAHDFGRAT